MIMMNFAFEDTHLKRFGSDDVYCACALLFRLDAGTFGTMGVGLGFAIAAELSRSPGQAGRVVCIEGDSAFGFSGMELETVCRLVRSNE